MAPDLDLRDASEVRRRVVEPVVRSLLRPDELEEVAVTYFGGGVAESSEFRTDGYLRVSMKACGEWLASSRVWRVDDQLWEAGWIADELFDALQNEVVESKFAWGQLRDGDYQVLPPQ